MIVDQMMTLSRWTSLFIRDAPFRPREETITESILVAIARDGLSCSQIAKATTKDEARRGHDWAWAIETRRGWINLMIQAKQISADEPGRYKELGKQSAVVQARKLTNAAKKASALPVYAFYNGETKPFGPSGTVVEFGACLRGHLRRDHDAVHPPWLTGASSMGITLAHARDVRDTVASRTSKEIRAEAVNRVAMPWECFLCPAWQQSGLPSQLASSWIARAAIDLATFSARNDLGEEFQSSPRWLSDRAPTWASELSQRSEVFDELEVFRAEFPFGLPRNVRYAAVTTVLDESWRELS